MPFSFYWTVINTAINTLKNEERRSGMAMTEAIIEGTLKPDGTLELDRKPNLPAGRVTVVLRQESVANPPRALDDTFFQMMEGIWAAQKARGFEPRSVEEVESERRKLRAEMEQEILDAGKLQEECRRLRQQAESEKEPP